MIFEQLLDIILEVFFDMTAKLDKWSCGARSMAAWNLHQVMGCS